MKKRDLYYERIPTKLLREDFRLLGTFLGRVIKDQEGLAFFKIVEKFRLLSKNTLSDKNKRKKTVEIKSPAGTFRVIVAKARTAIRLDSLHKPINDLSSVVFFGQPKAKTGDGFGNVECLKVIFVVSF